MELSRVALRRGAVGMFAAVLLTAGLAAPALGAATVRIVSFAYSDPPETFTDDCRGIEVVATATGTVTATIIETSGTFHIAGVRDRATVTFAFADGSYGTGTFTTLWTYNEGGGDAAQYTEVHWDTALIYSMSGTL